MRLPGGIAVWRGLRLVMSRWRAGGKLSAAVPVTAQRHAALHALVVDAAARAGAPPPRAITLGGRGVVTMRGGVLSVGLPLVWGLSAEQLSAVVAHELALPPTRHPRLVRALLAIHGARQARDTDLQPLADAVEQARDAAAIDALGGGLAAVDDAALALFRAEAVRAAFDRFAEAEAVHPLNEQPLRIIDLHDGWRRRQQRPPVAPLPDPDPGIRRAHPGFANELEELADGGPGLAGPASATAIAAGGYLDALDPAAVPLEELTDTERQCLAAEAAATAEGRWTRFADLPVGVYSGVVEERARRHVEAVEALLGGPPADRDELVDVLLRRTVEVLKAEASEGPPPDDGDPLAGGSMVADLIEYTLLKKGWQREHPAVRWRMTRSGGSIVDIAEHRRHPVELRRLLSGEPESAA